MRHKFFKKLESSNKLPLIGAICISIVLLIALFGKLFYPSELLRKLDLGAGFFEIFLIAMLFSFYRTWSVWFFSALVFAAFGGYSFYWFLVGLPCSCMGQIIELPEGGAVLIDAVFFALSASLAFLRGCKGFKFYLLLFFGCLMGLAGFFIAERIFYHIVNMAA